MSDGRRRRGRAEVPTQKLLEGEIKTSTHHPGSEHHGTGNKEDDASHEGHHEINIALVLGILTLPLELFLGKDTLDSAVGFLGILGREDDFDEFLDLEGDELELCDKTKMRESCEE